MNAKACITLESKDHFLISDGLGSGITDLTYLYVMGECKYNADANSLISSVYLLADG